MTLKLNEALRGLLALVCTSTSIADRSTVIWIPISDVKTFTNFISGESVNRLSEDLV